MIEVSLTPALYPFRTIKKNHVTVAIDVLRATTAVCAAFQSGCSEVVPLDSLDDLVDYHPRGYSLAADRGGSKVDIARPDGGTVVADRYTTSNAVHQCSKLPREQWDTFLDWLFSYEYDLLGLPAPDTVFYLRVDPAVSLRLLRTRGGASDIHEQDRDYQARSREAADYCASRFHWHVVECTRAGELRPVEDIHAEILRRIP